MAIEKKLGFNDVLIVPKISELHSRRNVSLERTFNFRGINQTLSCVPIIASNMDTIGTWAMAQELSKHKVLTCMSKTLGVMSYQYYWEQVREKNPGMFDYVVPSIGMSDAEIHKIMLIEQGGVKVKTICIDAANGYLVDYHNFIKKVRGVFPNKIIIAGNVVTSEGVIALSKAGANIIRVGIGSGSVCTTRYKTGIGYPQISAILDSSQKMDDTYIMSDGGCTSPGDICKAFVAGADMVMIGGMLSAHDECHGEVVEQDGIKYKKFYGMASSEAMKKYNGGNKGYRTSEGKEVLVPCKGPVKDTIEDIFGGIRSCCTYTNAKTIESLSLANLIEVKEQTNNIYGHPN